MLNYDRSRVQCEKINRSRFIILQGGQTKIGLKDSVPFRKQKMFDSFRLHIKSPFHFLKKLSDTFRISW